MTSWRRSRTFTSMLWAPKCKMTWLIEVKRRSISPMETCVSACLWRLLLHDNSWSRGSISPNFARRFKLYEIIAEKFSLPVWHFTGLRPLKVSFNYIHQIDSKLSSLDMSSRLNCRETRIQLLNIHTQSVISVLHVTHCFALFGLKPVTPSW